MDIAVISDELLKQELLAQGIENNVRLHWLDKPEAVSDVQFYVDLLFDNSIERINQLSEYPAELIIVNAVTTTCSVLPENFVRICAWPTFLKRSIIEAASKTDNLKKKAETVFSCFNKKIEWTPDIKGFISPRVISMIINEAYYTIEDKVTEKEEIDIAMKLGTKYPYGPFEWSKKIGLKNIYELLAILAVEQSRYNPCEMLKQESD